jgi:sterol desaturase/sphingolipid hydroxylase (fatty acid hydroxylase superfamily)
MQLTKFAYYADYVAYPLVIVGLSAAALVGATWTSAAEWCLAAVLGVALWTLMEYVLHRIALHRIAYFIPMHGLHHSSPLAFVGTPTWFSILTLSCAILAPTWFALGFTVASGLTAGVMFGYTLYGILHHLIHHRRNSPSPSFLNGLRTWHMRHHFSPQKGNFGVTTALWDHVFGTAIEPERLKSPLTVSSAD